MLAINPAGNVDRESANKIDGQIRASLRRGVASTRPAMVDRGTIAQREAGDINSMIERASGSTILEIDRLVSELLAIRSVLQSEGERVRNEITQYAGLSRTAVDTIRMVADTLGQLSPYTPTLPPRLD